jgi:hypothetical protein
MLDKYRAYNGGGIQGVSLFEPFNPTSDLGKLVIGGKITLSKGSQLEPEHRILIAQAAYLRVEMKELIAMKSRKQTSVKRKTIDEPGVVGWIQTKKRVPPIATSATANAPAPKHNTTSAAATKPTAPAPPATTALPPAPATSRAQTILPVTQTTIQKAQLPTRAPVSAAAPACPVSAEEGECLAEDTPASVPAQEPTQVPASASVSAAIVPTAPAPAVPLHTQNTQGMTAPVEHRTEAHLRLANTRTADSPKTLLLVDPTKPARTTERSSPLAHNPDLAALQSDSASAIGGIGSAGVTAVGTDKADRERVERTAGEQHQNSSAAALPAPDARRAEEDEGVFYPDIMAAAMF